jgi:uracil-DNA glycosylase
VTVHGSGPRNAKIMVVGEAPAYYEVQKGLPFVGDSGQELDKLFRSAGIHRPMST